MKKILTLFILLALVVSVFAGCQMFSGDQNNGDGQTDVTPDQDQKPDENPPADDSLADLTAAKDYVYTQYKDLTITAGDFDVTSIVTIAGVRFNVTWTTDSEEVVIAESEKANHVKVDIIPAEPAADIPYVLTATVSDANGNVLTTSFNLKVPKFAVNTYAQYLEAEADAPLVVEGVVSAIMSKNLNDTENSVFVQDLNSVGGYYVYGLADAPTVQIGQTVRVKGIKAIYNGTPEIKDATIEVVNEEITTVTPYDITEAFTAASVASDPNLVNKLGAYVVIRGVTVLAVSAENNSYYCFELDGTQTYLRISGSSNCATPDELNTIKANHADYFYYTADVAGIASIYSNKLYLIPVDANAFSNFSAEQQPLPDNVKVQMALDALKVNTTFVSNSAYTLPTSTFSDVTLTWALSSTENATIADGKLTPAIPAAGSDPVTVTLTATLNKGEVTLEKAFTLTIKNLAAISITEANTTATTAGTSYTNDKYIVTGVIKSVANTTYGNIYIVDEEGNELYVYGIYDAYGVTRYDALTYIPKAGDTVTLYGILGTYGSTAQMKNAWLLAYEQGTAGGDNEGGATTTPTYAVVDTPVVGTAYKFGMVQGNLENKLYYLAGGMDGYYMATSDNVANAIDVYLEETTGGYYFYCYVGETKTYINMVVSGTHVNGAYEATASTVYTFNAESKTLIAVVNDTDYWFATRNDNTYTTLGPCGVSYEGFYAKFYAPATTGDNTGGNTGDNAGGNTGDNTDDTQYATLTITEADALAAQQASGSYTTDKYLITGVIKSIANTTYGNMYIMDANGYEFYIYGVYDESGAKYGDMTGTKPVVGQTVTLLTVVGKFNNQTQGKEATLISCEDVALTGAQKIAFEKSALSITSNYTADKVDALVAAGATYTDVAITWTVNGTAATELNIVLGDAAQTLTVVATLTCGDATATKEFTVKVAAKPDENATEKTLAVFEFGANGATGHVDGNALSSATGTWTEGDYTLTLENITNVYGPAKDETGISCIKMGTSKATGSFSFTVGEDVTKVVIMVSGYKKSSNVSKVSINGGAAQQLDVFSNDGAYTAIEVDTTTNKTVTVATVSGAVRVMIDSITFIGANN